MPYRRRDCRQHFSVRKGMNYQDSITATPAALPQDGSDVL